MNALLIVALAVVLLCYCGGKYCPSVLKQNKEMLLGVLVGMALCSFANLKLEGHEPPPPMDYLPRECCNGADTYDCDTFNSFYSEEDIREKCRDYGL